MIIANTIQEVREQTALWRREGLTVGLVPTMGYLHEGHASLVDRARAECQKVIVSDFVNPTQFGPQEDLAAYPRDLDGDCALLEAHGCDLVFCPSVEEMYPAGAATYVNIQSELPRQLCGRTRPNHFQGVCTVVSKLFHIAEPDKAYFGQKDAQQLAVIRQMVRDLRFRVEIVACPTVREADGLARSSRNAYLRPAERQAAAVLWRSMQAGREYLRSGKAGAKELVSVMTEVLDREPLARVEYVEAVDGVTLLPVDEVKAGDLVALAVHIGKTRLIDNFVAGEAP